MRRRDFIKTGTLAGVSVGVGIPMICDAQETGGKRPEIWAIHGTDKKALMRKCLDVINDNGGLGNGVKTLSLKVNSAWSRTPDVAANTNPELVGEFVKGCRETGVDTVLVPENPCNRAAQSFVMSGIKDAVEANDGIMIDLKSGKASFKNVDIPGGRVLKQAQVAVAFLDTDCVVNMPVAKHHGGSMLSMAMKNWMGAVRDRGYWHKNGLHQCIADFSSFMKPRWTIIDATKIMLDSGPQGPARRAKEPDLLIVSRDQVSADAYAATLFHDDPSKVMYLRIASEMGLGVIDPERMNVHKLEA